MITADEIADKLRARYFGGGYLARCPAHEDRSPSLSIREGNVGVLLHCFAGCSVESICEALDIQVSDLFYERPSGTVIPFSHSRVEREALANLRPRLTPRERAVLEVTIVYVDRANPGPGFGRALALAVEQELVQCIFEDER